MKGILRGLTENGATTDPTSEDRRLLGRTYAIPFDDVWNSAVRLVSGELRGWDLRTADDQEGIIEGNVQPLLFGSLCDVLVEVGLAENAQTRVDVRASVQGRRADFGRSRRAIGRFFRTLDRTLDVKDGQILDPLRAPAWIEPN